MRTGGSVTVRLTLSKLDPADEAAAQVANLELDVNSPFPLCLCVCAAGVGAGVTQSNVSLSVHRTLLTFSM